MLYFQDTWYLYGIVTLNIYEDDNDSELIDEDMPLVFLLFSCTNYEKLYKTLINVSSIFHFIVKTIARIANAVQFFIVILNCHGIWKYVFLLVFEGVL